MKKFAFVVGLFLLGPLRPAAAKQVVVSTFTATNILPLDFHGVKTIALYAGTTNQVYLNDIGMSGSTQAFVTDSFYISSSSGILVLPSFHGQLWALAPAASAPVNVYTITSQ